MMSNQILVKIKFSIDTHALMNTYRHGHIAAVFSK